MRKINGIETFTRNEASKLTNVSISTLLFWEKQGLLKIYKDKENNYRYYTHQDLQDVVRLNFYRSIQLSIHDLKYFPLTLNDMEEALKNKQTDLEAQIEEIKITQTKIDYELKRYQFISKFKNILFEKCEFPFKILVRKVLTSNNEDWFSEMYSNYLEPMYQVYYVDKMYSYLAVSSTEPSENDQILYQYDPDYETITSLFCDKHLDSEQLVENLHQTNNDTLENLTQKLKQITDSGYDIKTIVMQQMFPLSDENNDFNDYYRLFLQVKRKG